MSRHIVEPYCLVRIRRKQTGIVSQLNQQFKERWSNRRWRSVWNETEVNVRDRDREIKDIWREKEKTNALGDKCLGTTPCFNSFILAMDKIIAFFITFSDSAPLNFAYIHSMFPDPPTFSLLTSSDTPSCFSIISTCMYAFKSSFWVWERIAVFWFPHPPFPILVLSFLPLMHFFSPHSPSSIIISLDVFLGWWGMRQEVEESGV